MNHADDRDRARPRRGDHATARHWLAAPAALDRGPVPRRQRDRGVRRPPADASIPECWGLDLNAWHLHVYRDPAALPMPPDLGAGAYSTHLTLGPNDTVSPLAVPNSPVRVADLLP